MIAARLDIWVFRATVLYCLLFSLTVPLANFALDMGILMLLGRLLLSREDVGIDKRWLCLAGLFLLICLLSSWQGYNAKISLEKSWQVGYNLIVPFALGSFAIRTCGQRKQLLAAIAGSLFVASNYEIWLGLQGLGSEGGGFLGRMQLAGQIIQAFPLLITGAIFIAWRHRSTKYLLLGLALLTCIALVFTEIRGAWIALGIVALWIFLEVPVKVKHKLIFGAVVLLLAGMMILSRATLQDKLVAGVTMRSQSVSERFLMWKSAYHIFLDHPALGIGIGNFGDLYEQKYILPEAKEGRHPHPHSIYLQTLSEIGLLGFVSFFAVFGYALRRSIANAREENMDFWQKAVPFAVVGFLVYGITDNVIYHFPAGFQFCWFIMGAGWNRG